MPRSSSSATFYGNGVYCKEGEDKITPEVACYIVYEEKDAKDFASTKHKGLPEKKVAKEAKDFSQR